LNKVTATRSADEPTTPRIGITGSLGRGNYGDELYIKNYQYWFSPWAKLYFMAGLPHQPYLAEFKDALVDMMDAIVIGGGDLLCPYREKIDRDFINSAYLRRPVYVAGIGVERNKPDILKDVVQAWSKFLRHENIHSISNRDAGSADWIVKNIRPNVPVTHHPDLVLALPLPKAQKPKGRPIVGLITRHIKNSGEYRILERASTYLAQKGWRVRHIIGGVGPHGAKDFENAKLLDFSGKEVIYTQDLDGISRALGECSLVLSMKLHTTIVAAMYGVPTISVNPVVKARAFMESIGVGHLAVPSMTNALMDILEVGIPDAPSEEIALRRQEAATYMGELSQRIWTDFIRYNPDFTQNMPVNPPIPPQLNFY
jgi:polysaccharide pyruvyl transferase WcaK-like protein